MPKHTIIFRKVRAVGTPIKPVSASNTYKVSSYQQPSISPTALDLQARLRARWPAVIAQARELEKAIPDPVQAMVDLLGSLPGDYATWRDILEEPYG